MKDTYYINNQQEDADPQNENTFDLNAAKINLKVVGVGGAGNNAIQLMNNDQYKNVDFLVANTDAQALALNNCKKQIPLGKNSRGLGAGSDPEVGKKSAAESIRDIEENIKGADVVIIAAGFGGGTGTGATPIIAEAAKNAGALTVAIITTPFNYEGNKRNRIAKEGIEALKGKVDSYIVISNDKLADKFGEVPVDDAFVYSNKYLKNIILTIHDILYRIGKINIDYSDVRKILNDAGLTVVGLGKASGKERAIKAVDKAFQNNLYKYDINGAQRFLINIQYDKNATINEIRTAISRVNEILAKNTDVEDDIIIGQERIDSEEDIFKVSIIAGKVNENQLPKQEAINPVDAIEELVEKATLSSQIIETINATNVEKAAEKVEKPYVAQKPYVPEKPLVVEKPLVAEKPMVTERPYVAPKPYIAEKPMVTERPHVVEKPYVAPKPYTAEKPYVAQKPFAPEREEIIRNTLERPIEPKIESYSPFAHANERTENHFLKEEQSRHLDTKKPSMINTQEIDGYVLLDNDENSDDVTEKKSKSELDIDSWFRI